MDVLLLPLLLLVFLGVPLLQMRKQNKRLKEVREFQQQLSMGDRVKTTSGLYGTISALGDKTVDLTIAPGITTVWDRLAILEPETAEGEQSADNQHANEQG